MRAEDVERDVLSRIKPGPEEIERALAVAEKIKEGLLEAAREMGLDVDVMLVGSLAKGTFMRGVDIDVFILFPPETPRDVLEKSGLEMARRAIGMGEERYAEHPYLHGEVDGFEIDIVPCYRIPSPSFLKSAVDRTPFHTRFVIDHLREDRRDDVLLLKQFMKGVGVYGAEAKVGGFSGYLVELLVIKYGSFHGVLEAAAKEWRPGTKIEIQGGGARFEDPLVFIDPVDPKRNVASPVSLESLGRFMAAAMDYLKSPDIRFFFPNPPPTVNTDQAMDFLSERGTGALLVLIERPDVVDDTLYPQVNRARRNIPGRLEEEGFPVIHTHRFVTEKWVGFLFELGRERRERVKKHHGPPVWSHPHAERFVEKWRESDGGGEKNSWGEPYTEAGRWVVEIPQHVEAARVVKKRAREWGLGKHLSQHVEEGRFVVLAGRDAVDMVFRESPVDLALFVDRRPPWRR